MNQKNELNQQIIEAKKCIAFWRGVVTTLECELAALPKEKPTGGRGKVRNKSIRDRFGYEAKTWIESDQIEWVVVLYNEAEQIQELRTQAEREQWIAERSGWKASTVHVQLSMARQKGMIPDKRYKP
jgi:hypothetical protein